MVKLVSFGKYSLFGQLEAPEGSIFDRYAAVRQGSKEREKVELRVYRNPVDKKSPLVTRFVHELKLLKQLNHPNIIKVLEAGYHDKKIYFATPLRPSISLDSYVNKKAKEFRHKELLIFSEALIDAVARLHEKEFVHRTLRVTSILVDVKHKIPYIADCSTLRDLRRKSITGVGVPHLSEVVAAPEQDSDVSGDKRTDVYLLAAVLYWLATDFHPLVDVQGVQKMKHQSGELKKLAPPGDLRLEHEIPERLERAIMCGLHPNPQERFADAVQMRGFMLTGQMPTNAGVGGTQETPAPVEVKEPPPVEEKETPPPPKKKAEPPQAHEADEAMETKDKVTDRNKIIDAISSRVEENERNNAYRVEESESSEALVAAPKKRSLPKLIGAFVGGAALVALICFALMQFIVGKNYKLIELAPGCRIRYAEVTSQVAQRVGKVLMGTGYFERRPNSTVTFTFEDGRHVLSFRVPQNVTRNPEVQRWHCRFGHVLSLNVFEGRDVGIRLGYDPSGDEGVIRLTARGTERFTFEGNAVLCVRPVKRSTAKKFAQVLKARGIFTNDSKSAVYLEDEGGKLYLELRLLGDARGSEKVVSSLQQTANMLSLRAGGGKPVVIRMYDEKSDEPLLIESSQS